MNRTRRLAVYLGTVCGFSMLCGAKPAPKGTEVTVAGGGGRHAFVSTGCGAPYRYRVTEATGYAGARGRIGEHGTWAVEGSRGLGSVTSRTPDEEGYTDDEVVDQINTSAGALRFGADWDHVGFSLGPALLHLPERDSSLGTYPAPSATFWTGQRDRVYVWGSLFEGPMVGSNITSGARIGIGHQQEFFSAETYVSPQGFGLIGEGQIADGWWLGVDLYSAPSGGVFGQDADLLALGRLTYRLPQRAPASE